MSRGALLRQRRHDGAPGHVQVHGAALGVEAGGRPPRVRRVRPGGYPHRGCAPQAVHHPALRRDREGAPRRVQHLVADDGGRAVDGSRRAAPCPSRTRSCAHLQRGREDDLQGREHARVRHREPEDGEETAAYKRACATRCSTSSRTSSAPRCSTAWTRSCASSSWRRTTRPRIAQLMLRETAERMRVKNMEMALTPSAMAKLLEIGFDKEYGARPLRRAITSVWTITARRRCPRRYRGRGHRGDRLRPGVRRRYARLGPRRVREPGVRDDHEARKTSNRKTCTRP